VCKNMSESDHDGAGCSKKVGKGRGRPAVGTKKQTTGPKLAKRVESSGTSTPLPLPEDFKNEKVVVDWQVNKFSAIVEEKHYS